MGLATDEARLRLGEMRENMQAHAHILKESGKIFDFKLLLLNFNMIPPFFYRFEVLPGAELGGDNLYNLLL